MDRIVSGLLVGLTLAACGAQPPRIDEYKARMSDAGLIGSVEFHLLDDEANYFETFECRAVFNTDEGDFLLPLENGHQSTYFLPAELGSASLSKVYCFGTGKGDAGPGSYFYDLNLPLCAGHASEDFKYVPNLTIEWGQAFKFNHEEYALRGNTASSLFWIFYSTYQTLTHWIWFGFPDGHGRLTLSASDTLDTDRTAFEEKLGRPLPDEVARCSIDLSKFQPKPKPTELAE